MERLKISINEKIVIAILLLTVLLIPLVIVKSTIKKSIEGHEQVQVEKAQEDLRLLDGIHRLKMSEIKARFKVIQQSAAFTQYIKDPSITNQKRLEDFWILTESYAEYFDRISYISIHGKEQVRVDYDVHLHKHHVIRKLSDESNKGYFKYAQTQESNELIIDGFDLEKHNGAYLKPYKPKFRFVQPIVLQGKRVGYLVLSIDLFSHREAIINIKPRLSFTNYLNSDGFYVVSPYENLLFGQLIEANKDANLKYQEPELWAEIEKNHSGVFKTADKIYCYYKIPERISRDYKYFVAIKVLNRDFINNQGLLLNQNYLIAQVVAWCFGIALLLASIFSYIRTKQNRLEDKLALLAFNGMSAVVITDMHNRIVRVNGAFTRITGYQANEVLGQDPNILNSGYHDKAFYQNLWKSLEQEDGWEGEIVNKNKWGEQYHELLSITVVRDGLGKITNYIASFMDIGDQKKREEELRDISLRDPMTGLFNRRHFDNMLMHHSNITARYHVAKGCCIVLLDIDYFKKINDTYGHSYGDEVINYFSDQLSSRIRKTDILARVGGEEFAIIMPFTQIYQAELLLEDIRSLIENNGKYSFTVSIGVACLSKTLLNKQAYSAADEALYYSKANGRNQISVYDEMLGVCSVEPKTRKKE